MPPPESTLPDTLFPAPALVRSGGRDYLRRPVWLAPLRPCASRRSCPSPSDPFRASALSLRCHRPSRRDWAALRAFQRSPPLLWTGLSWNVLLHFPSARSSTHASCHAPPSRHYRDRRPQRDRKRTRLHSSP